MALQDEIQTWERHIQTTNYAMSIGELSSLYVDGELDLQPHLQRFFRWNEYQQTRLIESILLGIPLPPIFMYQTDEGNWEVIDGVQRLSTIFQFMGILEGENGQQVTPLRLEKAEYLPSLQGKTWKDWESEEEDREKEHIFTMTQRLKIRRTKLDMIILREHGEWKARYELFYRLNRGGTILSDQEVRNFLVAMIDTAFLDFMKTLTEFAPFQECLAIPLSVFSAQFDMELVTKFIVYRHRSIQDIRSTNKIGKFLTNALMKLCEESIVELEKEREIFEKTFSLLRDSLQQQAFVEFDPETGQFTNRFSVAAYEAIVAGVTSTIEWWDSEKSTCLTEAIQSLWTHSEFRAQALNPPDKRTPDMVAEALEVGKTVFQQVISDSEI